MTESQTDYKRSVTVSECKERREDEVRVRWLLIRLRRFTIAIAIILIITHCEY